MTPLAFRGLRRLSVRILILGTLLFICAGTLRYWHAWVYLSLFYSLSALVILDLSRRDPELLRRRLRAGPRAERRPSQRRILLGLVLGFLSMLVIPAIDFRLGGPSVPMAGVVAGDVLFVIGIGFTARVYRENSFTSATIEIAAGQRLVDTGPYAIVRHPMYASGLFFLLGTPPALGSYWGLLGLALALPFLVWRLLDEEKMLAPELPGYAEYQARVRFRLVPGLW